MLTNDFNIGPFTARPSGRVTLNGERKQRFDIQYGDQTFLSDATVDEGTQAQVTDQLGENISEIISALRSEHEARHRIDLVDGHGERLASFNSGSYALPDMTAGLVDDRFPYWLRTADRLYSEVVTLNEYAKLRAQHELSERAWIADLLPADVLTIDPDEWRSPTHWELRHIIGEGSLTGITGAKAAALVGVNPSSFRKYTASESSKNRQRMSFAMWHLLLHRLEIQRLPEGMT